MVPVVLMNPRPGGQTMAARKTPARRAPAKTSNPRRRRRAPARRAAPRRRNPATRKKNPKASILGMVIGGVAGIATGAAAHALDQTALGNMAVNGIVAAAGVVLGGVTSMWSPEAGMGIMGAALGVAAKQSIDDLRKVKPKKTEEAAPSQTQQIKGMGSDMSGAYGYLNAVGADLGAVGTDLGNEVDAYLNGMGAELG